MNSDIFISNEVVVFFLIEGIVYLLQFVALYHSIVILKNWNFQSVTSSQYSLEKRTYLVSVLILFSFIVKIVVYPYFIYTLDVLSGIIPGAMCGAGVISANDYGEGLFILKSIILLFSAVWIVLNRLDLYSKEFLYLKRRFFVFLVLFALFTLEMVLNILYFSNLTTRSLVTCCSVIFSVDSKEALPFGMDLKLLLILFYSIFTALFISNIKKSNIFSGILSVVFLVISYYGVVYFFGTYIYELPTHHCPFCMLQYDYMFIGYFIFLALFLGFFFSFINFALKLLLIKERFSKSFFYGNIFNTIFVFIVSSYVVVYYLKNGVFL